MGASWLVSRMVCGFSVSLACDAGFASSAGVLGVSLSVPAAALSLDAAGAFFFFADAGEAVSRAKLAASRAKTVAREGPERWSERFMEKSCR